MIHDRFKDAPWYGENSVIVGGAGGINSWVNLLLSRFGYHIYLYDFDLVETHNLGGQLFGTQHIGKEKTTACKEMAMMLSDNPNIFPMGKYEEDSMTDNIVFAGFDNMAARKLMFEKWKQHQLSKTPEYRRENPDEINIFIDGRLQAELGMVYYINSSKDIERYEKELFSDEEVEEAYCSFRATSHAGSMIASWMVAGLTNQIVNKRMKAEVREVPFKLEFELPLLSTNIII